MGNLFSSSSTSVSTPAPSSKAPSSVGKLHVAQGSVKGPLETEPKSAPPTAAQDNLPFLVWFGGILSRLCYEPPLIACLMYDTATGINLTKKPSERIIPESYIKELKDAPNSDIFSIMHPTAMMSKEINEAFVKIDDYFSQQPALPASGQLHERYYSFGSLNPEYQRELQKNKFMAVIYIHTSNDLSCYIIADRRLHSISVIFRGTRSMKNVGTDADFRKQELCTETDQKALHEKVFKGVFHLEEEALHTIIYSMEFLATDFLAATARNPARVFSFGHSLGGALATFFTYIFVGVQDTLQIPVISKDIICCSYGSPRIFNAAVNNHFNDLMDQGRIIFRRYATMGDPITSLPPEVFGLVHGGKGRPVSIVRCRLILSTATAAAQVAKATRRRIKGNVKQQSFSAADINYTSPLSCTNVIGRAFAKPHAHGDIARISLAEVLAGFQIRGDIVDKKTVLCKVMYMLPSELSVVSHIFDLVELRVVPQQGSDTAIQTYDKFKEIVIAQLHERNNAVKRITRTGASIPEIKTPVSRNVEEHVKSTTKQMEKAGNYAINPKSGQVYIILTCEEPLPQRQPPIISPPKTAPLVTHPPIVPSRPPVVAVAAGGRKKRTQRRRRQRRRGGRKKTRKRKIVRRRR